MRVPENTSSCRLTLGVDEGKGRVLGLLVDPLGGAVGAAGPGTGSASTGISASTVAACLGGGATLIVGDGGTAVSCDADGAVTSSFVICCWEVCPSCPTDVGSFILRKISVSELLLTIS